jgi:hypothetical protein
MRWTDVTLLTLPGHRVDFLGKINLWLAPRIVHELINDQHSEKRITQHDFMAQ